MNRKGIVVMTIVLALTALGAVGQYTQSTSGPAFGDHHQNRVGSHIDGCNPCKVGLDRRQGSLRGARSATEIVATPQEPLGHSNDRTAREQAHEEHQQLVQESGYDVAASAE